MLTWLSSFWDAITTPPLRDYIATSAATVVFIIGLFTFTQKRTELKSTLRSSSQTILPKYTILTHELQIKKVFVESSG